MILKITELFYLIENWAIFKWFMATFAMQDFEIDLQILLKVGDNDYFRSLGSGWGWQLKLKKNPYWP